MNINQFNLKDKESIIINNPSGFKRLKEEKTEINLDLQIENCVKIVMINGKLNTDLSDQIPENYHIDSINNSNKESLSKVACFKHPVVTNNTENFKNGLYIESKQEHPKPIYIINYLYNNDTPTVAFPRIFIQCNKNSSLKVIEHTVSSNHSKLLNNF